MISNLRFILIYLFVFANSFREYAWIEMIRSASSSTCRQNSFREYAWIEIDL